MTKTLATTDGTLLTNSTGTYIVAEDTAPTQPLVTSNSGRLTSKARHIRTRAGSAVVARSTGKDTYTRGGTQPLVTPNGPLLMG